MTNKAPGTALITGGAQRIGESICLKLASIGYDIALHYNTSSKEAKQTSKKISALGRNCHIFSTNLLNEEEHTALIRETRKIYPNLNLLINNASVFEPSKLLKQPANSFDKHFSINLKAPMNLMSAFAKHCKRGQIINILDTHITCNQSQYLTYLLSKKSLHNLTKLAALEFAPNIRVNSISPGLILPPKNKPQAYMNRLAKKIPLKRRGSPKDITKTIAFLIESPYITGQNIFVDGGEHLL